MMAELGKGESIPRLIRELLEESGAVSSGTVAERAGVTRQAAHYHLRRLVEAGELAPVGKGRASRYTRRSLWTKEFEITGLEEDIVWRELSTTVPELETVSEDARTIARYAFTEMLNNAIDHSRSELVTASVGSSHDRLVFSISDSGIGAFENVRKVNALEDHVAAIQEIAKGKLTTDPARHSGQGIFFTSKAVDVFVLSSNGWKWLVDNIRGDEAISRIRPQRGTQVQFRIDPTTTRSLRSVFDEFTDETTYAFDKTRTVVHLFEYDVSFVSRSEAKRLTRNLEKFSKVIIDFQGVDQIGQGFADEIFRVWRAEHPDVELIPIKMNEAVTFLVEQAHRAAT